MRSAAVLLSRTSFLAHLKQSNPRLIEDGLIARFHLQELGRDEIETFIRRQRCPGDERNAFTAEAIAAIADISCGDPALVNHLARLTLEFAELTRSKGDEQGISGVDQTKAALATVDERPPPAEAAAGRLPSPPLPRRRSVLGVLIGLFLGLAIAGLVVARDDGVLSLAQRAEQSLAAIRSAGFEAWIKPGRESASSAEADSASRLADVTAFPIAADHSTRAQAETVSVAAILEHPGGERADASSTHEAASPQPTRPNDQTETIATPAPQPTSARSVGTAPATAVATTASPQESEPTPPQPAAVQPHLATAEVAALVKRGDDLVGVGDIASARLFYERAVEAGDGRAALRMGATFDPAFLDRAGIRSVAGNQQEALSWYRHARDLGEAEAVRRLGVLKP
jgi:hypothetical protein